MVTKSVLFFPSVTGTTGGGGSSLTFTKAVLTGALVAGAPKTLVTGMGYANYSFTIEDATNMADVDSIIVDPANPTNAFIIQVGVDLPLGLTVNVHGW